MTFDFHEKQTRSSYLQWTNYKTTLNCGDFPYWDTMFKGFSNFVLYWPRVTFDLHNEWQGSPIALIKCHHQVWIYSDIHLLRYISPLLDFHYVFIICSLCTTITTTLKFRQTSLLEALCLQATRHQTHTQSPSHRFLAYLRPGIKNYLVISVNYSYWCVHLNLLNR